MAESWKVVGLDLAGKETRPTGVAVLTPDSLACLTLLTDEEVFGFVTSSDPDLVAIDAPLSKPSSGWLRDSDRELIRRGLRVLPPMLGPMRSLTERGMRLASGLRALGVRVVEVHPGSTAKVLGVPRTAAGVLEALKKVGISVRHSPGRVSSIHEVDAALAALTGALLLMGRAEVVGGPGGIALPRRAEEGIRVKASQDRPQDGA
ncbi:MAG: DUF429 domain-containing protein [Candidatus Korarchaeota archaeon]|nr:DUF429 domain-containing protein [Candidatus Korarchaeota archaeon]